MPFCRLGILEDTKLDSVPGTVTILDDDKTTEAPVDSRLKHDPSGKYILVPQPSNDPNDPLNWPRWRRDLVLFIISLEAVIASSLSPILAADTLSLSVFYHMKFTKVAELTGWHLLGVAVGGVIFVPSSRIWGKRHAFVIGCIIIIISSAWGGGSNTNYKSALAARIFQGIGLAPFEGLLNAVVGDLYFVHERGLRMALTNFCVFGGSFLTPVIAGRIARAMGWPWTFYFIAIFSAVMLPFLILFVPETAYSRDARLDTDIGDLVMIGQGRLARAQEAVDRTHQRRSTMMSENGDRPQTALHERDSPITRSSAGADSEKVDETDLNTPTNHYPSDTTPPPPKTSFIRSLALFNGRKTHESFFKLFLRPFVLLFHPAIMWAYLIQGAMIGWTVFIGVCIAAILISPPLFFNEEQTGYEYTGAFVGALIGFIIAGALGDSIPALMTRLNRGRYEPEFRLILVIPQLILGCAGLYGFGIVSNNIEKYRWFWPSFFFALEVAGMVIGAVASSLYIVDAYRGIAVEAFTCMMIFKNIFSFALTFKAYDWLLIAGYTPPIFKGLTWAQIGVCCLTIPMYVLGKKSRSFFARHDLLKIFKLA